MDDTELQAVRLTLRFERADILDSKNNFDLGAALLPTAGLMKGNGATAAGGR